MALPSLRRAAARASAGDMPRATLSSVSSARYDSSSRARSRPTVPGAKQARASAWRHSAGRRTRLTARTIALPPARLGSRAAGGLPASAGSSAPCGCSPTCPRTRRSSRDPRGDGAPDRAIRARPVERLPNACSMTWAMVWPCAGPSDERLQHEHVERALHDVSGLSARSRHASSCSGRHSTGRGLGRRVSRESWLPAATS